MLRTNKDSAVRYEAVSWKNKISNKIHISDKTVSIETNDNKTYDISVSFWR